MQQFTNQSMSEIGELFSTSNPFPIRRIRHLPPREDDWSEPERPTVTIDRSGANRKEFVVELALHDHASAEWLAHWLTTKDAWSAFGAWLDRKL